MQRADWGLVPVGICTEYSEIQSHRNDSACHHCILKTQSQKWSSTCCLLNQKQSATSNIINIEQWLNKKEKLNSPDFNTEDEKMIDMRYSNIITTAKMMHFNLCYELKLLILTVIFYPELCLCVKLQRQEHWPKSSQLCQLFFHFLFIFPIVTRDSR